jgi:hypothetical protein
VARGLLTLTAATLLLAGCGGSGARTDPQTSTRPVRMHPTFTQIGSLPQDTSKTSAVALPGGKIMILGGLVGDSSLDTILAGKPNQLQVVGHLPQPTHDAAAALLGGSVYLFGGGSSVSTPYVVRVDPATGAASSVTGIGEPLSDLGAATVGGKAYLVGGFTGTEYATAILRYGASAPTVVARLPQGTRYAGVTSIDGTIYVAGGLTTSGATKAVYAVSPGGKVKRFATLPDPEAHAGLAALDHTLYLVGGRSVIAISPRTGKTKVVMRLPASLSDASVVTVGDKIVVAGGGTHAVWALRP